MVNVSVQTRRWILKRIGSKCVSFDEELWALRSALADGEKFAELYMLYLKSKWWQGLRVAALERDGGACVLCGSTVGLQVDHKWYPGFGRESLVDVQTLCQVCHQRKSKYVLSGGRTKVVFDTKSMYKTLR